MADEADTPAATSDDDVRVPSPIETFVRWFGPPRNYVLTRWLVLRLLGFVYVFAFLGIIYQGLPLLGSHGLTPAAALVDQAHALGQGFLDIPSVFMWNASDTALQYGSVPAASDMIWVNRVAVAPGRDTLTRG